MDRRRDGIVRGENGLKAGWDCPACKMDRRRDGIFRGENGPKAGWDCPL